MTANTATNWKSESEKTTIESFNEMRFFIASLFKQIWKFESTCVCATRVYVSGVVYVNVLHEKVETVDSIWIFIKYLKKNMKKHN